MTVPDMPFDEPRYRSVARDMCEWATYGDAGVTEQSERYKLVTEGRDPGPKYSSCADLAHWMLFRLGVRSLWLNRDEEIGDGPGQDWEIAVNVSNLAFGPCAQTPIPGALPGCGDIWIVWAHPKGTDAHVLVCEKLDPAAGVLHSWDYGQATTNPATWKPHSIEGRRRERAVRLLPGGVWMFPDGRRLQKTLPLWATLQKVHARGELWPLYETPSSEAPPP